MRLREITVTVFQCEQILPKACFNSGRYSRSPHSGLANSENRTHHEHDRRGHLRGRRLRSLEKRDDSMQ